MILTDTAMVLLKSLILIFILLTAAGYMTLVERVLMARLQLRVGPNRVGFFGLLQPLADGIKLLTKESFEPQDVEKFTYWIAPAISIFVSLFVFALIPFGDNIELFGRTITLYIANIDAGILFILSFAALSVYGIVLAGWASNNRYSLLGGLRGTAQIISYEVPMGLAILTVVLDAGTLRLPEIVNAQGQYAWFIFTNPISFMIFLITAFAETNRAPFDLPESEQELIGGFNTEYGGIKFAMFFVAEYINILASSALLVCLFLGGWHGPWNLPIVWFLLKVAVCVFLFILVRVTIPRFRYDQLMAFGWKILVPLATVNFIVSAFIKLV